MSNWKVGMRGLVAAAAVVALTGCASEQEREARQGGGGAGAAEEGQATASFRGHHAELLTHLGHIDAMAMGLADESPEEQRATMQRVVGFLEDEIGAHAAEEERVLYPVVAREGGERLTEVPVFEHRVVERWIATLEKESLSPRPDTQAFTRDALHLVGLLRAHFEMEEEVLLAELDRTMSAEEFEREVGSRMH